MPEDYAIGWREFEKMVRTGVPHAQEIAKQITNAGLSVPAEFGSDQVADLRFYCVVHFAFRLGRLTEFLEEMKQSKSSPRWLALRDSKLLQLDLVNQCNRSHRIVDTQHHLLSAVKYNGQTL